MEAEPLQLEDTCLAYRLSGQGEPILLIQGVGVIGRAWLPQVEDLEQDHAVVTFDNRGIGQSSCTGPITIEKMADDALRLMDHLGWSDAHVMGHSMGGIIAQEMALRAPARVRSLTLMCTFARGSQGARVTPETLWMGLRTRIGTRAMRRSAFLDVLYSRKGLRQADRAALARGLEPLVGRDLADSPPILMQQLQAMARHPDRGLPQGRKTLVLCGLEDPIARWEYSRELVSGIAGAQGYFMEDAAHGAPLEHPALVNARLRRFLKA